MKIKLQNGETASEESIQVLESELGFRLSGQVRDFLRDHNGAKPETNTFKINDKNDSGVNGFIPVNKILGERAHIENVPARAYPIAWAEGGNYLFVDEARSGAVFFWDHETAEVTELAGNFEEFLELVQPFDIRSIKLKPGQVRKGWIDPEFLKRVGRQNS